MTRKKTENPADFIQPLNINGLEGRVLHLPARKKNQKEILFVYGHHSSLERWWGLMQVLNRHAAVTMPDLPGFGGMDSFYTIGKKPSIDNLADYLASYIKLRYKRRRFVLVGMSYGFVVATRMLQKYPELTKKVDLLVSLVGFAHKDDFLFKKTRYYGYLWATAIMQHRPLSWIFRYIALHPRVLRAAYARTHNAKHKFASAATQEDFQNLMDVEIGLWHDNEVRTYMYTTNEFLRLDNCQKRVDLPLVHVSAEKDHFFDNHLVEQHMRVIYADFQNIVARLDTHAPSVIADEKAASKMIPPQLRKLLANL